ncbi:hypothetical protein P280DRAFT_386777 [Massarina eburnea CBS 473.64]|uniref:Glycine cleavage system H protein n=1 Tax=Massarina eburnea CBS 473.64 TaxID=1395130 RepID=A0A6A6SED6_9PLEO|nr:hypothetical protein P280DRAFT_386777 [Massarina eburnea CBS 473.64]
MAARFSVARAARQLTSQAARRPSPFACQRWQRPQSIVEKRLFTVSAAAREKKYTDDHEWIELSDDKKTCTLGISTYAAHALGDVIYVELPSPEMEVSAGEAIGAVESVKSASDILSPVSGTVYEVNSALEDKPGQINIDPEDGSWIAKITLSEEPEGNLMSAEEYKAYTEDA